MKTFSKHSPAKGVSLVAIFDLDVRLFTRTGLDGIPCIKIIMNRPAQEVATLCFLTGDCRAFAVPSREVDATCSAGEGRGEGRLSA